MYVAANLIATDGVAMLYARYSSVIVHTDTVVTAAASAMAPTSTSVATSTACLVFRELSVAVNFS